MSSSRPPRTPFPPPRAIRPNVAALLAEFEHPPSLGEQLDTGSFLPGDFEKQYEQLFAEAIEDGEITPEERQRLNLAAAALGLDAARVMRVEDALLAAYEGHAAITLVDRADPGSLADGPEVAAREEPPASPSAAARDFDDRPTPVSLRRPPPQAHPRPAASAEAAEQRALHTRYVAAEERGDVDAQYRLAAVLVQRTTATPEQVRLYESRRSGAPPRPRQALTAAGWVRLLHPDEDRTTGEIFGVIASAALLGRVSALRRDRSLPVLDPEKRQDATASTISAVRAVGWAAATLGMRAPPVYVAPEEAAAFEIVTAVPPALRIGGPMLAGQTAQRLAFHCGRHLSWFREEHFVCTLIPAVTYLEDLFLAALSIGAPHLDLRPDVRARVALVAEAIVPVLEPAAIERLQRQVARFLAQGGRTSLRQWAQAAEWTALRAGLLLCDDLATASDIVRGEPNGADRVRELERFWASDDAGALRVQLGIAIPALA